MKVAKLEKDPENEKASSLSLAASVRLAEDTALRHKDSFVTSYREGMRLKEELKNVRADYSELQGHLVGSVNAVYENLKEQVRVLALEVNLTLFSLDNVVRDGKIVPDDPDDDDVEPPPAPAARTRAPAHLAMFAILFNHAEYANTSCQNSCQRHRPLSQYRTLQLLNSAMQKQRIRLHRTQRFSSRTGHTS